MPKLRVPDNHGFTLVEVLLATTILTVGLVGLLQAFVSIHSLETSASEHTIIQSHIGTIVDEVREAAIDDLRSYTPPALIAPPTATIIECLDAGGTRVTLPLAVGSTTVLPNPIQLFVTTASGISTGHTSTVSTSIVVWKAEN